MPQNKETSVGVKLVADLRNYQKNLSTAQKNTRAFQSNVKNSVSEVSGSFSRLIRGDLTALPGLFKASAASAGGFSASLKGVKAALIATGIGAIIVALGTAIGALVHYFKSTEEGQIVFKRVMNNVKAYIEPVLHMFGQFGKALVQLFKGDFKGAWSTAKDAVKGVGDQIKENNKHVGRLNELEEKFIKEKRQYLIDNKKLEAEIAEARRIANDEDNYSATQRAKAINEAIEKQKLIAKNKKQIAADELEIEQIKASFGDNDIATNDRLAELKARQYEITREQEMAIKRMGEDQQRVNRELVKEIDLRNKIAANAVTRKETAQLTTIETKKFNGPIGAPDLDTGTLADMGNFLDANAEKTKKFREELLTLNDTQQAVVEGVTNGFNTMANGIINALDLADSGFQGFLSGMIQTITKLIAMALSQSLANAIAGATTSGAATGPAAVFTTPAFIATAVGGVLAAFASIPKFAEGGIVPGSLFSGDRVLARLNSGEEVLTRNDPRHRNNQGAGQYLPADVKLMDDHILISYTRALRRKRNTT